MQEKKNIVAEHSARLGLNTNRGKSKIFKVSSTSTASVTLGVESMEEVDHFTCLDSVVDTQGGTEANVKLGLARNVLLLKKQIQDFQYKCQGCSSLWSTWKATVITTKTIQTFVNSCLRRILGIWWPDIVSRPNERMVTHMSDAGGTGETMEVD